MSNITVVLVEGHELGCTKLKAALEQIPEIEVLGETTSGRQALKIVTARQPQIAIIEIDLPDINGIQLIERLKTNPTTEQTKILVSTTRREEEDILAAFRAGADAYLLKDIHLDSLAVAIHATQQGYAWIDPSIAKLILQQVCPPPENQPRPKLSEIDTNGLVFPGKRGEQNPPSSQKTLTQREREVLKLIVHGCNNAAISEKLFITVGTVKTHVRSILNKLSVEDRTQAAVIALRTGLVE
jgi:DNA-binding NarL/FixJ family response regulator